MSGPAVGSRVLMETGGRYQRVVHRLERVKGATVLYPYVMTCGYVTRTVVAAPADAPETPCKRCWRDQG